jgi:hypothetical protein
MCALQKRQPVKVVKRILEGTASPAASATPGGKSARDSTPRQPGRRSRGGAQKEEASPLPKVLVESSLDLESTHLLAATPTADPTPTVDPTPTAESLRSGDLAIG